MSATKKQLELQEKILLGIKKTHEKVIEFKKKKGTPLVVMRDNDIVNIKPWEK
jgi:hypothetical protein